MSNLLLLYAGTFLQFAGIDGFQQFFVAAFEEEQRGKEAISALVVLYFFFWFFSRAQYAPRWVQRIPHHWALVLGAAPYTLLPLSVGTESVPALMAGAAVLGIGAALYWVAVGVTLNACSRDGAIGRNTSYHTAALYIGGMVSTAIGGWFLVSSTFTEFSRVCAGLSLCGLVFYGLIRVSPITVAGDTTPLQKDSSHSSYFFLTVFSAFFLAIAAISCMKVVVTHELGPEGVAVVGNVIKIVSVIGCLFLGYIADRIAPLTVLIATTLLCALGLSLFALSDGLWGLACGSALVALFFSSIRPLYLALMRTEARQAHFSVPHAIYARYSTQGMFAGLLVSLVLDARTSILIALSLVLGSLVSLLLGARRR